MRLVDDNARAVALGELDDGGERRHVAVHREDRIGDDQTTTSGTPQTPREVVEVAVLVDERVGKREPAAVDDRGVVQCIGENGRAALRERRDDARVREVAGPEEHARLAAGELRESLLQPRVDRHRARYQSRRARPGAPAQRRVRSRLAHARMLREPEVVVRAQQQDRLAVDKHLRPLRAADNTGAPVQSAPAQIGELSLEVDHPRGSAGTCARRLLA